MHLHIFLMLSNWKIRRLQTANKQTVGKSEQWSWIEMKLREREIVNNKKEKKKPRQQPSPDRWKDLHFIYLHGSKIPLYMPVLMSVYVCGNGIVIFLRFRQQFLFLLYLIAYLYGYDEYKKRQGSQSMMIETSVPPKHTPKTCPPAWWHNILFGWFIVYSRSIVERVHLYNTVVTPHSHPFYQYPFLPQSDGLWLRCNVRKWMWFSQNNRRRDAALPRIFVIRADYISFSVVFIWKIDEDLCADFE